MFGKQKKQLQEASTELSHSNRRAEQYEQEVKRLRSRIEEVKDDLITAENEVIEILVFHFIVEKVVVLVMIVLDFLTLSHFNNANKLKVSLPSLGYVLGRLSGMFMKVKDNNMCSLHALTSSAYNVMVLEVPSIG